mmetsp:Transcript_3116/g.4877  ORF Transcript_3116/g.4877 Transcript_3116/m.4877 type:complete len:90 (-) Transcript_3116:488-757(-)
MQSTLASSRGGVNKYRSGQLGESWLLVISSSKMKLSFFAFENTMKLPIMYGSTPIIRFGRTWIPLRCAIPTFGLVRFAITSGYKTDGNT